MKLTPVTATQETPEYPERRWRRPTWARRVANVVTLSLALALGSAGCGGDWRNIDDDDEEWEVAPGAMPAPTFWCADERPEYIENLWLGDNWGELCGESTGWATFQVDVPGIYRFALTSGGTIVDLALLEPSGEQIAQIDADMSEVTVELSPGTWTLAATAVDPVSNGWGMFHLLIEQR